MVTKETAFLLLVMILLIVFILISAGGTSFKNTGKQGVGVSEQKSQLVKSYKEQVVFV
jgi:hypothetical protein